MTGKTKPRPKKQAHWFNKSQMAKSIGISVQAFDKWGIDPVAKIGRETFYTVDDVLEFYVERELAKVAPKDNLGSDSIEEQLCDPNLKHGTRRELLQIKKLQEDVRRLELQNAVLEGKSLPARAVTEVLATILSQQGSILDSVPMKIRRKFPKTDMRIVQLIGDEIIRAMNAAHDLDELVDGIIEDVVAEAEERVR